ncbi:hypothetical protein A2U01_0059789, partial [Trifolium medium]|nr:hypothetical protein [Trifolium medium]
VLSILRGQLFHSLDFIRAGGRTVVNAPTTVWMDAFVSWIMGTKFHIVKVINKGQKCLELGNLVRKLGVGPYPS